MSRVPDRGWQLTREFRQVVKARQLALELQTLPVMLHDTRNGIRYREDQAGQHEISDMPAVDAERDVKIVSSNLIAQPTRLET
jgi:hypothetical protein